MTTQEAIKDIKQQFMVYRNGAVADTLRKAGYHQGVIFGLNVPQLADIARTLERDTELAAQLWNDRNVRESRLLASYLFPLDATSEQAKAVGSEIQTREEADMLAFKWLRFLPFAGVLADEFAASDDDLHRYLSEAIHRFID